MDLNQLIQTSQQSLGKLVQRTPLTDKLLSRPPFKYLHDLITEILTTSQLAPGLYSETELDSNNIKDKEGKIAFLQKIIDFVSSQGRLVVAKPAKIVAGLDAEDTNAFLQALAEIAIATAQKPSTPVPSTHGKSTELPPQNSRPTTSSKTGRSNSNASTGTPALTKSNDQTKSAASTNKSSELPAAKRPIKSSGSASDLKPPRPPTASTSSAIKRPPSQAKLNNSQSTENIPQRIAGGLKSNASSIEDNIHNGGSSGNSQDNLLSIPQPQQQPPPAQQANSRAIASQHPAPAAAIHEDSRSLSAPSNRPYPLPAATPQQTSSTSRNSLNPTPTGVSQQHQRLLTPSSPAAHSAPGSASSRRPSTSAQKRSPLKPSSSGGNDASNNNNNDDDEEFVVIASPFADGQLIGSSVAVDGSVASTGAVESQSLLASIDPSGAEHGGLMRKILETSKALAGNQAALGAGGADSASGVPSSTTNDAAMINLQSNRYKERAVLKQQIEDLRKSIQDLCRNTAPLGRILDYYQEDLDSMNKEMLMWKEEEKKFTAQLAEERKVTDSLRLPLEQQYRNLCEQITEQSEKIDEMRSQVMQNDQIITRLLSNIVPTASDD